MPVGWKSGAFVALDRCTEDWPQACQSGHLGGGGDKAVWSPEASDGTHLEQRTGRDLYRTGRTGAGRPQRLTTTTAFLAASVSHPTAWIVGGARFPRAPSRVVGQGAAEPAGLIWIPQGASALIAHRRAGRAAFHPGLDPYLGLWRGTRAGLDAMGRDRRENPSAGDRSPPARRRWRRRAGRGRGAGGARWNRGARPGRGRSLYRDDSLGRRHRAPSGGQPEGATSRSGA